MAHMIESDDSLFSTKKVPWHGLGIILEDYPTVEEAKIASGLTWKVRLDPITYTMERTNVKRTATFPDAKLLVREDTGLALSVVGNRYVPYQNDQMWSFIEQFMDKSGAKLETAGSLMSGRIVWALAKNGEIEYRTGDPVHEFFLFKNAYTGNKCVEVMFTNVRVVCNNTLTAALRNAENVYRVRHTAGMDVRLSEVETALNYKAVYDEKMTEVMQEMVAKNATEALMRKIVAKALRPVPKEGLEDEMGIAIDAGEAVLEDRGKARREAVIDEVIDLVETGMGTEIPGVRGTIYGLFQAGVEWNDHYRPLRGGSSFLESKFKNSLMGNGAAFKQRLFDNCVDALAA